MDFDVGGAEGEEPAPSSLSTVTGHAVEFIDKLAARYTGEGRHSQDVGSVQANLPAPKHRLVYYYGERA